MKKLDMHSAELSDQNVQKILEMFPNCRVERLDEKSGNLSIGIDFNILKQELSNYVVEEPIERYHLNWPGKRESILAANRASHKTLRPVLEESVNFEKTRNLFIEGDNLEALKLLRETYLGKVKLIYIDPPYNTGKDFIYHDNFNSSQKDFKISTGQISEEGINFVANKETDGRFHSNWLSMMAPRLRLAKSFLQRDGAIFVSCDEREHPRLRLVMDEIFGQQNFVSDLVWAAGWKNNSKFISNSHEYIVCYARDIGYLSENNIIWRTHKKGLKDIYKQYDKLVNLHGDDYQTMTKELKKWYTSLANDNPSKSHKQYSHVDARGIFFPSDISSPGGDGPKYEVLHPITGKPVKVPSRGWIFRNPQRMQEMIDNDQIYFREDENFVPCVKSYLKDMEKQTPYSVFYQDGRAASKRLRKLMGEDLFDFPKDEQIIQEIVEMLTDENDLVMDFFAGSSSTAHAVFLQNAKDGKNRKFIMVQLNEEVNQSSQAHKSGFKTISEVSRKRIKLSGEEILKKGVHSDWNKDIGIRALKIDSTNMQDIYYTPDELDQKVMEKLADNVKSDRSEIDLLFQIMIEKGVDISLPITEELLCGVKIFFVDEDALATCLSGEASEDLAKEIAVRKPQRMVIRESCFKSDQLKINFDQIFLRYSPHTEIRSL